MSPSVSSSNSRISGSSSTIRTWGRRSLLCIFQALLAADEGDAEAAATVLAGMVVEAGAVAFAQLPGHVQPQPAAPRGGGEERVEYIIHYLGRYAAAPVYDIEE